MRPGEHAAEDGSFGRSAFGAMGRGIALIVAAVVLGVILLRATDSPEPFAAIASEAAAEEDDRSSNGDDGTTSSTAPEGNATTEPPETTAPAAIEPDTIIVKVANAEAGEGVATRFTETVEAAGYQTVSPANAAAATTSTVYFVTADSEAAARQLATMFDPVPAVAALPDPSPVEGELQGAQVVLVVAPDLASTG